MFHGRCEHLEGARVKRHVERRAQEDDFAIDGHLQGSPTRLHTYGAGSQNLSRRHYDQTAQQSRAGCHDDLPSTVELQGKNGQLLVA